MSEEYMSGFLTGQNSHNNNCCDGGMMGGGWFIWIILIFAIFGGWGNSFGGNAAMQGALTRGEMYEGFNTAEIQRSQGDLMRGQFDIQKEVMQNRFDASAGFCGTQKEILDSRYTTQLGFQGMQAQMDHCCCDLKTAIHAEAEATRALINQNTMQELRDNLQAAQLQLGNLSQTNTLLSAINKVPVPAYLTCSPYQAGYNPYAVGNGCGCGCNG